MSSSGAFTVFKTKSDEGAQPKSSVEKDIRSRQIDELVRISEEARKDVYGQGADEDNKNFYNIFERTRKMPTFRPRISAPQLQMLLLSEAADLTDVDLRVFLYKGEERDKEREKFFERYWRREFLSLHLLISQIYAQFSGTAFVQGGNDPYARNGKGSVWLRPRHQQKVHCDPNSWWPPDWSWQVIEEEMQFDRIRQIFGDAADAIKPRTAKAKNLAGPPAGQIEMPPGPMSQTVRGLPVADGGEDGATLTTRFAYVQDATLREPTELEVLAIKKHDLPIPKHLPMFPQGRMIVDCEGTVVSDGPAWLPLGDLWPAIPVWATPPWDTVWCPSPVKYTKSLQDAAEQQMSQVYENARRLNNGFMVIHGSTGLTANMVGGLPGEVVVVSANSVPQGGIEIKYPQAFPAQMIQLPQMYLGMQKEMRGSTPARAGNLNPGNVGPDLFEAAVSQSQSGLRLTARLFAWSVQKIAELVFYTMSKTFTDPQTYMEKGQASKWEPIKDENYTLEVPYIRPMSQSALRNMVIELRKAGMIDIQHALDWLDVPDADEIAEGIENEQKLAALAKQGRK